MLRLAKTAVLSPSRRAYSCHCLSLQARYCCSYLIIGLRQSYYDNSFAAFVNRENNATNKCYRLQCCKGHAWVDCACFAVLTLGSPHRPDIIVAIPFLSLPHHSATITTSTKIHSGISMTQSAVHPIYPIVPTSTMSEPTLPAEVSHAKSTKSNQQRRPHA